MTRRKLALRRETIRALSGSALARVRGGEDWSFVYSCTAPWSEATTCDPSNRYVCPMGPQGGA